MGLILKKRVKPQPFAFEFFYRPKGQGYFVRYYW